MYLIISFCKHIQYEYLDSLIDFLLDNQVLCKYTQLRHERNNDLYTHHSPLHVLEYDYLYYFISIRFLFLKLHPKLVVKASVVQSPEHYLGVYSGKVWK